jgi:hypothetical protein
MKMRSFLNLGLFIVFAGFALGANAQSTLDNGLIAKYSFNGNANDLSGNGHNGKIKGATLTSDRFNQSNRAYSCDGTKKGITIPALANYNATGVTISIWVKTSKDGSAFQVVQGAIGTLYMNVFKNGRFLASFDGTYANNRDSDVTATTITSDTWVNLTATNDGSVTKVYVNGSLERTYNERLKTGGSDFIIGNQNFEGSFDDLRIYSRAITAQEVSAIYGLSQ